MIDIQSKQSPISCQYVYQKCMNNQSNVQFVLFFCSGAYNDRVQKLVVNFGTFVVKHKFSLALSFKKIKSFNYAFCQLNLKINFQKVCPAPCQYS